MVVHIIVYVHKLSWKHTFGKGPPTEKSLNQSAWGSGPCTCKLNSNTERFHSDPRFYQGNMGKPMPKKTKCRLSKEEETVFVNRGFTAALQHAVIQRGWDKRDIEDFIITYNHNNKERIPVPTLTKGMLQEIWVAEEGLTEESYSWNWEIRYSCSEEYTCSGRGWCKEASQIQAWDSGSPWDKKIPEVNGVAHQKTAFPAFGERNCDGIHIGFEVPVSCNYGYAGGIGSLPSGALWRFQPVCHPCKAGHHYAQRHTAGKMHPWRKIVSPPSQHQKSRSFQDHPNSPKGESLKSLKVS